MFNEPLTRRTMLRRTIQLAVLPLPALLLQGCGKSSNSGSATSLACTDTSGLTAKQKQKREVVQYEDHTPHPKKPCSLCIHYEPDTKTDTCGKCKLVPGPIHPDGYCTLWSGKIA